MTVTEPVEPTSTVLLDDLTRALARAALQPRLREAVARAEKACSGCAVCVFDVDHFKSINDAFGHLRGDATLRDIVVRCNGQLRVSDVIFRLGGDEFVLLLPGAGKADALAIATRILESITSEPFVGEPPLAVGISLGVACFPDDASGPDELLAVADRRNYVAKRRGRGCVVADDDDGDAAAVRSSRLIGREEAAAAIQAYLERLAGAGCALLRVGGPRGAGYSRVGEEVATLARLHGFDVVTIDRAVDIDALSADAARTVIIADGEANWERAVSLSDSRLQPGGAVGLVLLGPGRAMPDLHPASEQIAIELGPWSFDATRVWLRTRLRSEPPEPLVTFIHVHSAGLPARAERLLGRLRDSGQLERGQDGWVEPTESRLPETRLEFVGRGREIDELVGLLAVERLVTLVGAGGIGKTQLAIAAARAVADRLADGAVFVSLAEATTRELVASAVAHALGGDVEGAQDPEVAVAAHLDSRDLLLVLDNFEQVVHAAPMVGDWLARAPGLSVLATSRQRLRLSNERLYAVGGLTLPNAAATDVRKALNGSSAVALFASRAKRVAFDFALTPDNVMTVAELCRCLDGSPLAIELAAARVDEFAPRELLARLGEQLELLAEGPQDVPARQQSVRGAIDWSFGQLEPRDRELFAAMSIFSGGATASAIAAVWPTNELQERLTALVEKSLLAIDSGADGTARFAMLETIRAYAGERLLNGGASVREAVRTRHARFFAAFAERDHDPLAAALETGRMSRMASEQHNLRVAMTNSLDDGDAETAARIATAVWLLWPGLGPLAEGDGWHEKILAADGPLSPVLQARLLYACGSVALMLGDLHRAARRLQESLDAAQSSHASRDTIRALRKLSQALSALGNYPEAEQRGQQSLALAREHGDRSAAAMALIDLGDIAIKQAELDTAHTLIRDGLELFRKTEDVEGVMHCVSCLGEILMYEGDNPGARSMFEEALEHCRRLQDGSSEAWNQHHLGLLAHAAGDRAQAAELLTTALIRRHEFGERQYIPDSLEAVAGLALLTDPMGATRIMGVAERLRVQGQVNRPPVMQQRWEANLAVLREVLADAEYDELWSACSVTAIDDAVTEAVTLARRC